MIEVALEYQGQGRFQTLNRKSFEAAEQTFERGETVRGKLHKRRSVRQNDYFHGLIEAAFENQRGGPMLPSWRHLKSHLLIKAGHCDEVRVSLHGLAPENVPAVIGSLAAALKRQYDTVEVSYNPVFHAMMLRFARPWRFEKTDSDTAARVFDKVIAIICTEIVPGVDPKTIMDMARSRAA